MTKLEDKYKNLKMIVTVFTLVIIAAFSYIHELKDINKNISKQKVFVASKKSEVLVELVKLSNQYDKASKINTQIASEFIIEKEKMLVLMEQIEKMDEQKMSFNYFNKQINAYYSTLTLLTDKSKKLNESLALTNDSLINNIKNINELQQKKSPKPVTNAQPTAVETKDAVVNIPLKVIDESEEIKRKNIEKLSKINITNLKVALFSFKKSNKLEPVETAKEVEVLKINFTIPQNFVVRASTRNYYIQVLDSDNNFVGESTTINIGNQKLTYSLNSVANYKNKALIISEQFNCKNFKKGNYIVKVYDKSDFMSQTNFTLK